MTQHSPVLSMKSTQAKTSSFRSIFVHGFFIAVVVTIVIVLLFISIGEIHLSHFGAALVKSFLLCMCIGIPSTVILSWIALRLAEWAGRWIHLINSLLLIGIALLGLLCADWLFVFLGLDTLSNLSTTFFNYAPFSTVAVLTIGISVSVYERMRYRLHAATLELHTRQLEQEHAYKLLAEAQLSSLESRMHPHFLFNTLNSIAALIHSDPLCAERTLEKLASLLRFSLTSNKSGTVDLCQEVKIVHDYLEIEKTRFRQRLRFTIDISKDLEIFQIPPLALQTLVENAIKHVVSQRQEGATITIRGTLQMDTAHGEIICIEVSDDGPGFSLHSVQPEHGLGNLIGRLKLLYGSAGQLHVERRNNVTIVMLFLPARPNITEVV